MRPAVLVGVVIAIATCCSCSDSDHITLPSSIKDGAGGPGVSAEGGAAGSESTPGGGPTANAGADTGAGSAGAPEPDAAGAAGVGASPEAGGGTAAGGGGGAPSAAGTGGAGGSGPNAGEALSFCPRLAMPSLNAFNVTRAYDHAVYADCRVTWVTGLYLQAGKREEFLDDLLSWSYALWGCGPAGVTDFALIYQTAPLTSADAKALIDDYIAVATTELTLSSTESNDMRAALVRLSKQTVTQDSADYSHSSCVSTAGTSGTGGSAGASGSSGTAGAGGTAGSGPGVGGSNL